LYSPILYIHENFICFSPREKKHYFLCKNLWSFLYFILFCNISQGLCYVANFILFTIFLTIKYYVKSKKRSCQWQPLHMYLVFFQLFFQFFQLLLCQLCKLHDFFIWLSSMNHFCCHFCCHFFGSFFGSFFFFFL